MTPQQMLEVLLAPDFSGNGRLANDFLAELGKTIPFSALRLLLASENKHTRATGAFLATFQNRSINSMIEDVAALLQDEEPRIRYDALEAIRNCTKPRDGIVLGRALLHLNDPSSFVRWGAIGFVRWCSEWQLSRACRHAALLKPYSAFPVIETHCANWKPTQPDVLRWMLDHPEAVVRRFGAGLAGRPQRIFVDQYVRWASALRDSEISDIAKGWMADSLSSDIFWHSSLPTVQEEQGIHSETDHR